MLSPVLFSRSIAAHSAGRKRLESELAALFDQPSIGDLIEAFSTEKLAADLGALTTAKA